MSGWISCQRTSHDNKYAGRGEGISWDLYCCTDHSPSRVQIKVNDVCWVLFSAKSVDIFAGINFRNLHFSGRISILSRHQVVYRYLTDIVDDHLARLGIRDELFARDERTCCRRKSTIVMEIAAIDVKTIKNFFFVIFPFQLDYDRSKATLINSIITLNFP